MVLLLISSSDLATRIDNLFVHASVGTVIGTLLPPLVLFGIGILVVHLHKETIPVKAYQLGIAAPAMVSIWVGTAANKEKDAEPPKNTEIEVAAPVQTNAAQGEISFLANFFPSATAQQKPLQVQVNSFKLPEETFAQQFWRGVNGTQPANRFYVAHDSFTNLAKAVAVRDSLTNAGIQGAEIYKSSNAAEPYRVVLGKQLNLKDATTLSQILVAEHKVASKLIEVEQ
jgi:hypothetical protein